MADLEHYLTLICLVREAVSQPDIVEVKAMSWRHFYNNIYISIVSGTNSDHDVLLCCVLYLIFTAFVLEKLQKSLLLLETFLRI